MLSSAKLSIFPFPAKDFQLRFLIFSNSTDCHILCPPIPPKPVTSKNTAAAVFFMIPKTLINSVVRVQVHDDDDEGDEDDDKAHPSRTSPSSSTRARQWQMQRQSLRKNV